MAEPPCQCLECRLRRQVDEYYRGDDGKTVIDVSEVITKTSTLVGEMIVALPDRGKRRSAAKFAHDAIDAGIKAARAGTLVPVAAESATEH